MAKTVKLSFLDAARMLGSADGTHDNAITKANDAHATTVANFQDIIVAEIKKSGGDKMTRKVFDTGWTEGYLKRKTAEFRNAVKLSGKNFREMPDGEDKGRIATARNHCSSVRSGAWARMVSLANTGTKTGVRKAKAKKKVKGTKTKTVPAVSPELKKIEKATKSDAPLIQALQWAVLHRDEFMAWIATVMPAN